jgi:hypothetical protein
LIFNIFINKDCILFQFGNVLRFHIINILFFFSLNFFNGA